MIRSTIEGWVSFGYSEILGKFPVHIPGLTGWGGGGFGDQQFQIIRSHQKDVTRSFSTPSGCQSTIIHTNLKNYTIIYDDIDILRPECSLKQNFLR
jgi:hypothetical protein